MLSLSANMADLLSEHAHFLTCMAGNVWRVFKKKVSAFILGLSDAAGTQVFIYHIYIFILEQSLIILYSFSTWGHLLNTVTWQIQSFIEKKLFNILIFSILDANKSDDGYKRFRGKRQRDWSQCEQRLAKQIQITGRKWASHNEK